MTNKMARTNPRLTAGLIGYDVVAVGSSSTSAAATAIGTVTITHGMATPPKTAYASPLASNTLAACGRFVGLKGMGAAYITFITASAPPGASLVATYVKSAVSSGVTMTFVWVATR